MIVINNQDLKENADKVISISIVFEFASEDDPELKGHLVNYIIYKKGDPTLKHLELDFATNEDDELLFSGVREEVIVIKKQVKVNIDGGSEEN